VVMALLEYVRPVLEEQGEFSAVEFLLFQVLSRGTGAAVQRDSYARATSTRDVVADAVHITRLPTTPQPAVYSPTSAI
jgi:carboxylate-amine ligase